MKKLYNELKNERLEKNSRRHGNSETQLHVVPKLPYNSSEPSYTQRMFLGNNSALGDGCTVEVMILF